MATKRSKAAPRPLSSDEDTPSRIERSRSRSLASGPKDRAGVIPPAQHLDMDEQVARLV